MNGNILTFILLSRSHGYHQQCVDVLTTVLLTSYGTCPQMKWKHLQRELKIVCHQVVTDRVFLEGNVAYPKKHTSTLLLQNYLLDFSTQKLGHETTFQMSWIYLYMDQFYTHTPQTTIYQPFLRNAPQTKLYSLKICNFLFIENPRGLSALQNWQLVLQYFFIKVENSRTFVCLLLI